jgi:hypothetical protein
VRIEQISETEIRVVGTGVLYSHRTLSKMGGLKRYRDAAVNGYAWHFSEGKCAPFDEIFNWVVAIQNRMAHPDFDTPVDPTVRQVKGKKGKGKKKNKASTPPADASVNNDSPANQPSTKTNNSKKKQQARRQEGQGNHMAQAVRFAATPNPNSHFQSCELRLPRPYQGQNILVTTFQRDQYGRTTKLNVPCVIHSVEMDPTGFVWRATFLQMGGIEYVTLWILERQWQIKGEQTRHYITFK